MSQVVLRAEGVTKRFGGFVALESVALQVAAGERLGLIGPNGSGKTTLINCISGALTNDEGRIEFEGRDVTRMPPHRRARLGVARTFQIPKPFRSMSVLENLVVPLEYVAHRHALHAADTRAKVMAILEMIGLADKADTSSNRLSQVELRKLELARAMARSEERRVGKECRL